MSTASKARGRATERMVVEYLQRSGFHRAERRRLKGAKDEGDVTGIAGVCVEIKGDRSNRISAWKAETVEEAANAGEGFYFLVVRVDHKPVERWEVHIPWNLLDSTILEFGGELEDWQWVRMDLELAARVLKAAGYT